MKKFSVLELLHPDGIAHTSFVLGSNCPEILRPELQSGDAGDAELFILAPSAEECSSATWLNDAVHSLTRSLAEDGVGYVLIPPRWRKRAIRLFRQAGLVIGSAFWHSPNVSSSRYMVPVERIPGQFAIDTLLPKPSWKRFLAVQIFRHARTRSLLTIVRDDIGISVRRPGARPLFQWLYQGGQRSSPGTAIVRTSWREGNGASITYGFSGGVPLPSVIAKTVPVDKAATLKREAQLLAAPGTEARRAGVDVPEILERQQNDRRFSLLLSFISGQPTSDLLAVKAAEFSTIMQRIVDWLERWQRTTVTVRSLKQDQLEQILLKPLDRLTPSLQHVERYREWLLMCWQSAVTDPVPLVATHNDLTMANVLWKNDNQLGVVDWETACPEGWPLVDFHYAATDAVRIAAHCINWLDAFRICYQEEGVYKTQVMDWRERLRSSIGVSPSFAEVCFHACWLHHASNEQQANRPGENRPFFEIVQWIATHEFSINNN